MPKYEVRLGRMSRIYERAIRQVEADDEYHASALAYNIGVENDEDEVSWDMRDCGAVQRDARSGRYREIKDD